MLNSSNGASVKLSVGTRRRDVTRLSAAIADALGGLLHGAIAGQMTVLAAVEALLRTAATRLAVARHVTNAAAGLHLVSMTSRYGGPSYVAGHVGASARTAAKAAAVAATLTAAVATTLAAAEAATTGSAVTR